MRMPACALFALLVACGGGGEPIVVAAEPVVEPWALPAPAGAAQPDLVATAEGDLLLSWIEPDGEGHVLSFARFRDGAWSAPRAIARGTDWFVNWADTPHLLATPDGALWAHWLQKSAAATYAYDVALVRSADGGANWSAPVLVNDDGTPTEHGFASLWATGDDALGIAWLDGRETFSPDAAAVADPGGHGNHGGAAGAMTLRSARIGPGLQPQDEARIDGRVCDCCQTAVAPTARGPLLAYRDRSEAEIRDISVARLGPEGWQVLGTVHDDGWEMPACPVNGPAIAADGEQVVVAWYTAAGNTPQVRIAHSADAGDTFAAPVTVDTGDAVYGRVGVVLADGTVWVLWTREDASGQSLHLAGYGADLAPRHPARELARLQGRGRGTGFPQFVARGDALHAVWTDISGGVPSLQGALIHPGRTR